MHAYCLEDTIAAVATPPGNSRLGIVRVSGPGALALGAMFAPEGGAAVPEGRGAARGELRWQVGGVALAMPVVMYRMPGPRSYTGEDALEFIVPGSAAGLELVLEELCRRGARRAAAGEFTFRAFYHGRLTLSEVGAVAELIGGADDAARLAAADRLRRGPAARLGRWREGLAAAAALVEAEVDFSEEETPPGFFAEMRARLAALTADAAAALETARRAPQGEAGPRVGLVGLTNAGKSALANRLLGREASIVAPEPSTTRDALERPLLLEMAGAGTVTGTGNGEADKTDVILVDCPGDDPGPGPLAAALRARADGGADCALRLAVVDAVDAGQAGPGAPVAPAAALTPPDSPESPDIPGFPASPVVPSVASVASVPVVPFVPPAPPPAPLARFFASLPAGPLIVVYNKCDWLPLDAPGAGDSTGAAPAPASPAAAPAPGPAPHPAVVAAVARGLAANPVAKPLATLFVSARTGAGVAALKAQIAAAVAADCGAARAAADCDRRTAAALAAAAAGVGRADACLAAGDLEGAAFELRDAYAALSADLGATYSEEVLTAVFSHFCVGK